MAKGQKRSTREAKKPKADKKPAGPHAAAPAAALAGKLTPPKGTK